MADIAAATLAEWFADHRGHRITQGAGEDEETGATVTGLVCERCREFLVMREAVNRIVPDERCRRARAAEEAGNE